MTSTELKIGLSTSARPSSRVLKPPGGGHTNIFAEPEETVNAPRPKYNQQNSSNLNACMGSTDANLIVEKLRDEITQTKPSAENIVNGGAAAAEQTNHNNNKAANAGAADNSSGNKGAAASGGGEQAPRGRVPPGGYSSGGFW